MASDKRAIYFYLIKIEITEAMPVKKFLPKTVW